MFPLVFVPVSYSTRFHSQCSLLPNACVKRWRAGTHRFGTNNSTSDIALPPGYKIEAIASGLTFPSAVAFDDSGHVYAIEAGYSYGEVWTDPQLLRIDSDGKTKVVAKGTRNGPWTGITWHNGAFYVAEGGEAEGGRILRIGKDGTITPLLSNLPSVGDHHTNGPVVKDGYIYFGQGTATNSGVVGEDNADFGWLKRKRDFHDIPCRDITLLGQNYTSENILGDSTWQCNHRCVCAVWYKHHTRSGY
jgi:glucose/arabinose dehydrogenase